MKQSPENEIDLLLRRLGRDEWPDTTAAESEHLDADELNSYAENVLPEVARAKYTEHLADCSRCRRLVTELAPAAVPRASAIEKEQSALSRFLSQLMSPMFLRYAVPGLAAVLILTFGLVLVRRQPRQLETAQNEQPNTSAGAQLAQQTEQPAAPVSVVTNGKEETKARAKTLDDGKPEVISKNQPVDSLSRETEASKQPEAGRVDRPEPVAAPAISSAGASPTGSATAVAKSNEVADKKKVEAEQAAPKEEGRKLDNYQVAEDAARVQSEARARRGPSKPGAMAQGELPRDKQEKDSREVRTVAGRRFHRENGIWIDTAYDSGATTNLSRGSEQYRALVADEPGIRTIAEALDGDIIVVWKGRAYRIR